MTARKLSKDPRNVARRAQRHAADAAVNASHAAKPSVLAKVQSVAGEPVNRAAAAKPLTPREKHQQEIGQAYDTGRSDGWSNAQRGQYAHGDRMPIQEVLTHARKLLSAVSDTLGR